MISKKDAIMLAGIVVLIVSVGFLGYVFMIKKAENISLQADSKARIDSLIQKNIECEKSSEKIENIPAQNLQTDSKAQTDDFVQKNIECEKNLDAVSAKIERYNSTQKPEIKNSNNSEVGGPVNNLYVERKELKELFYSPKADACLYLEVARTLMKNHSGVVAKDSQWVWKNETGEWLVIWETYSLVNASNDEKIDSFETIKRGEGLIDISYSSIYGLVNNYRFSSKID